MNTRKRVAVVAAMPEELSALLAVMPNGHQVERAGRSFWTGAWGEHELVVVLCGIGKVAAAITTTLLVSEFGVGCVLFTGVAGGLGEGVRVGDVVVASHLLQHDMDASPLFPRYELPGLGRDRLEVEPTLLAQVTRSASTALSQATLRDCGRALGLVSPRVHQGLVISGDLFVDTTQESDALRKALPDALAVEMEGAALAQVCHSFGIPFAVIRTISDRADDSAHLDFQRFVADVASRYSLVIVMEVLKAMAGEASPNSRP